MQAQRRRVRSSAAQRIRHGLKAKIPERPPRRVVQKEALGKGCVPVWINDNTTRDFEEGVPKEAYGVRSPRPRPRAELCPRTLARHVAPPFFADLSVRPVRPQIEIEEADYLSLESVLEVAAKKLRQYQYQAYCACNVRLMPPPPLAASAERAPHACALKGAPAPSRGAHSSAPATCADRRRC